MKTVWIGFEAAFAGIGGALGWFLGGFDGFLYALVAFVAVDYLSGVMCAAVDKKLSSAVGAKGIFRKVLIFVMVGVANMVDVHIIGAGCALRTAVIFFYVANEGLSLIENAAHLGLPVPERLKDALAQIHGRDKKDAETASEGAAPGPTDTEAPKGEKEGERK
jgi:toxin secretion/phage lysis holin